MLDGKKIEEISHGNVRLRLSGRAKITGHPLLPPTFGPKYPNPRKPQAGACAGLDWMVKDLDRAGIISASSAKAVRESRAPPKLQI
jgi:hypothetical protein